jgi:hypothetical protein
MKKNIRNIGRSNKLARYYAIHHWLVETAAWKSLSATERQVYIEMALLYNGSNNGRICFGARHGEKAIGIGKTTTANALKILQERGFISIVRRGHFAMLESHRAATEWRLTEFPCEGELATKNFA